MVIFGEGNVNGYGVTCFGADQLLFKAGNERARAENEVIAFGLRSVRHAFECVFRKRYRGVFGSAGIVDICLVAKDRGGGIIESFIVLSAERAKHLGKIRVNVFVDRSHGNFDFGKLGELNVAFGVIVCGFHNRILGGADGGGCGYADGARSCGRGGSCVGGSGVFGGCGGAATACGEGKRENEQR